MDSDLIFFRKPKALLNWINSDKMFVIYLKDCLNSYWLSDLEVRTLFGNETSKIKKLNSGIVGLYRKNFDLKLLSKFGNYVLSDNTVSYRFSGLQQYFAILFSKLDNNLVKQLPKTYFMSNNCNSCSGITVRHFTGWIRNRTYFHEAKKILSTIIQLEREA